MVNFVIRQPMRTPWCTHTGLIAGLIAGGKEFGVHIGWRKYLYECTPFGCVNL